MTASRRIIAMVILGGAAMGTSAWAQGAEPAKSVEVEAIIVTAGKREQNLVDVSVSIQAVTGRDLERRGISDVGEVMKTVPGASLSTSYAAGLDTYQIRGVNSGTQGDATVGFYLDELAFYIPNVQIAPGARLYDLKRVEILRGPQGTLYGQGSMGGTVKQVTEDPVFNSYSVKAQGEYATTRDGEDSYSGDAAVNLALVPDRVSARLVISAQEIGGVADRVDVAPEEDIDDVSTLLVRGKLRVRLTDDFEATINVAHSEVDQDYQGAYSTVEPPVISGTGGATNFVQTEWNTYALTLRYDLGWASLESATGLLEVNGVTSVSGAMGGFASSFDTQNLSQELRLVSQGDSDLAWIVGAYAQRSDLDSVTDLILPFPGFVFHNQAGIEVRSAAIFGEVSYKLFGGRLIPLLGLRQHVEERTLIQVLTLSTGPLPQERQEMKTDSLSPRFNLSYRPNDDGQIYLNIAKGYRGGAVQELAAVAAAAAFGVTTSPTMPPDTLWSYELGAKWTLFDDRLRVEAAAYMTRWSDATLQITLPTSSAALINVGDIDGQGLDLGAVWRTPLDGLTLIASANVNRTEFNNPLPAAVASTASVCDGCQIPNVPKWTVSAVLDYQAPYEIGGFMPFGNLSLTRRGEQIGALTGDRSEELRDVSLRIGARGDRFEAAFFASNLTDERGPVGSNGANLIPQRPRTIGVALKANFP